MMLARFIHTIDDRGLRGGTETRIPKLFYRWDTKDGCAGHWRTFPRSGGGFIGIRHHWNQTTSEWTKVRVWNLFGLVTIINVPDDGLKHSTPRGWHFRFAKITVGPVAYKAYGIVFHSAPPGWSA